jgi:hypothetical protein
MVRTSGPLDIARATASEASGFTGGWQVGAFAVCARPQDGIHSDGVLASGSSASDTCSPDGYRTHGAGGGGGLVDGGQVWLQKIAPNSALDRVDVAMTGPLPDGKVVVQETCAIFDLT